MLVIMLLTTALVLYSLAVLHEQRLTSILLGGLGGASIAVAVGVISDAIKRKADA